jgi:hypothetical protein
VHIWHVAQQRVTKRLSAEQIAAADGGPLIWFRVLAQKAAAAEHWRSADNSRRSFNRFWI